MCTFMKTKAIKAGIPTYSPISPTLVYQWGSMTHTTDPTNIIILYSWKPVTMG